MEEAPDAMNLDLNLGPGPGAESEDIANEGVNLEDWINVDPIERFREAVRIGATQRWRRWRPVQFAQEGQTLPVDLDQLIGDSGSVGGLLAGEGSIAAEERANEDPKMCENGSGFLEDKVSEKKDDVEKGSGTLGSFFDCNICFDLASDPVVTCCGHLFCWACLYTWLHLYSGAKECPVCKGEVTIKNVTPIYGRGTNISRPPEEDSTLEIPNRPQGRRVESMRQAIQRNHFIFPMEEVIRRLGSRLDVVRESTPSQDPSGVRDITERSSLLNRIMSFRGMRAEQSSAPNPSDVVDLTQSGTSSPEGGGRARRLHSMLFRRSQPHAQRASAHASLSSAVSTAERMVEYLRNNPLVRNQDQAVDDRDSFSSIAAVINSESQLDTAVEIDSMVSLSTSSSRRRNDNSRASDVDSGDSRAPRRRRLN
ncbi:E3 ubiquitin-protein ligase RMA3 [Linum perenne]